MALSKKDLEITLNRIDAALETLCDEIQFLTDEYIQRQLDSPSNDPVKVLRKDPCCPGGWKHLKRLLDNPYPTDGESNGRG